MGDQWINSSLNLSHTEMELTGTLEIGITYEDLIMFDGGFGWYDWQHNTIWYPPSDTYPNTYKMYRIGGRKACGCEVKSPF